MELSFAGYKLLPHERQLIGPAGHVALSGPSFDILHTLVARPQELVSKQDLLGKVWRGVVVEDNTLQVHVASLRKILGPGLIATVHGRGYKYTGPLPLRNGKDHDQSTPADGPKGNVPQLRPPCVEREEEFEQLGALLKTRRLVSIVGPGGVGKTSLAIETGARLAPQYSGGVWIVDLAPIADQADVASAVVRALAVPFRETASMIHTLVEYLRSEKRLIVLDNCEHLLPALSQLLGHILVPATQVSVLVTSQEPLKLEGEAIFRLEPFYVPSPAELSGDSRASTAYRFFRHCYEAESQTLPQSEIASNLVLRICRSLDGIPLVLKMAAIRASALGLDAVDQQLSVRLGELSAQWRTPLSRHQTLHAALTWSYGLLTPEQQRTFRAISIFSGSFSLAAAKAVAGSEAADHIAELVRKSLVKPEDTASSRYRLLEILRNFGLAKLEEHSEKHDVHRLHTAHFLALSAKSIRDWEDRPDDEWNSTYDPDSENIRSALEWTLQEKHWREHASLAATSWRLWVELGLPRKGLDYAQGALRAAENVLDKPALASLKLTISELAKIVGLLWLSYEMSTQAIETFREFGDRHSLIAALGRAGFYLHTEQRHEEATKLLREAEALLPEDEHSKLKGWVLIVIGMNCCANGKLHTGLRKMEVGIALQRSIGNMRGVVCSALNLAESTYQSGNVAGAIQIAEEHCAEFRRKGYKLEVGYLLSNLAAYYLAVKDTTKAAAALQESVSIVPSDNSNCRWCVIQNFAALKAETGECETAARLFGFVDRCFASGHEARQMTEQIQYEDTMRTLRAKLSEAELQALLAEGAGWGMFEANHFAGISQADNSVQQ